MGYDPVFDEYHLCGPGLPRTNRLRFCPWCGRPMRPSQRARWYAEIARRGVDPDEPGFPPELRTDAWWRRPRP